MSRIMAVVMIMSMMHGGNVSFGVGFGLWQAPRLAAGLATAFPGAQCITQALLTTEGLTTINYSTIDLSSRTDSCFYFHARQTKSLSLRQYV